MPIYEYQCAKCGEFEVTQRITDETLKRCPTCRSKVKKLISNTSFQLKGSGWYITDYARKDGGTGKDSEKSTTESTTKSEATTKSESKSSDTTSSETKTSEAKTSEAKTSKKSSSKAESSKAA
jgi:putative FmdB family regulatory protein